jgi:hypothetical protein
MWRAVGTSVVGASHQKLQIPCQDSCDYRSCILGSERVLIIGIADGAGSAKASDIGSQEIVAHLLREISNCGLGLIEVQEQVVGDWLQSAREHLSNVAAEKGIAVNDLACTVLFAILGDSRAVFGQVGDGAWIIRANGNYTPATWPSRGEYANQTTFITSTNWREVMQFKTVREPLSAIAGFSDGLQDVALHFASRSVHAPFFDSKFEALETIDDDTSLRAPLIEFLSSAALGERTDDDKTLVLACRREVKLLGNTTC